MGLSMNIKKPLSESKSDFLILISAIGPRTTPMTTGANGQFATLIIVPITPKPSMAQRSNTEYWTANVPITQDNKTIGNKRASRMLNIEVKRGAKNTPIPSKKIFDKM